ncbi:hypothetical protein CapIbe_008697 [Capra ibex]
MVGRVEVRGRQRTLCIWLVLFPSVEQVFSAHIRPQRKAHPPNAPALSRDGGRRGFCPSPPSVWLQVPRSLMKLF